MKMNIIKCKFLIAYIIIFISSNSTLIAQELLTIFGKVTNTNKQGIELVLIAIPNTQYGAISAKDGAYELKIPKNKTVTIVFNHTQYIEKTVIIDTKNKSGNIELNIEMITNERNIEEITVTDRVTRTENIVRIDPKFFDAIPNVSGGIERMIITGGLGVSSNNELSSQYSVRGGSFDENLVYVNDIEVFRPFLIRSGQQEGLSFTNPDMVSSLVFSAGGFDAKYGDKMSSVLDVKYRKPQQFGASLSASLLGASAHIESSQYDGRFSQITGIRYKTNQYLLGSLESKGEYKPAFIDFQTYMTFSVNPVFDINLLANYSQNRFWFVPETRETSFGTIQNALKLKIYFDGQEIDYYNTFTGALAADFHPDNTLKLKFIATTYVNEETENFDILGQYYLNVLDKELGSENIGDSVMNLGIGSFLSHARNSLDAKVYSLAHKGYLSRDEHSLQWGAKIQKEIINDQIWEWRLLDSAGYSIAPYNPENEVNLSESLISNQNLNSVRYSAYFQDKYLFEINNNDLSITAGVRATFWDFTQETNISPRASFSFQPYWKRSDSTLIDILFRFSAGIYYQPPFYKELRDRSGKLNESINSQRSIHFVLGADYNFKLARRPFKFIGEIYYKHLDNLIPYELDNVRQKYLAFQIAKGYVAGIDLKLNGEFVKDAESWLNMSVMKTQEDIIKTENGADDGHGYIARPTDQIFRVAAFFQDYFPGNRTYLFHLTGIFGTGLPFGPPNSERYKATLRMPAYRRVDVGLTKVLKSEDDNPTNFLRFFKSVWLSAEVFNLLGIYNTISYFWVQVVPNQLIPNPDSYNQYAVPNRLTDRRINVRLIMKF